MEALLLVDHAQFRMKSMFFGSRQLARDSLCCSFDLELPLEVDDEYWEHPDPTKAFKQPPGIPCSISYFISFLKLNQILAFALRTIVSTSQPHYHRFWLVSSLIQIFSIQ